MKNIRKKTTEKKTTKNKTKKQSKSVTPSWHQSSRISKSPCRNA